MKTTSLLIAFAATSAIAAPLVQRDPPKSSSADAINSMTTGATNFGPAFLAGDAKGVLDALNGMLGGAASFTPGFFNDLAKASAASAAAAPAQAQGARGLIEDNQSSTKEVKADQPQPATAGSLNSMFSGASNFAPKWLAGDSKGVAEALNGIISGATSFTPNFFSDLAKANGGKAPATQ
jgi:hypothetical protein